MTIEAIVLCLGGYVLTRLAGHSSIENKKFGTILK